MSTWIHHDPDLERRTARQLEAHASGRPAAVPISEAVADLRAWLVDRAELLARLTGSVSISGDYATINPVEGAAGTHPPERLAAAQALYAPLRVLAAETGQTLPPDLETTAPSGAPETGALPAVATVAIVVGAVVAVGLLANQAGLVVDRQLERNEQTRRMLAKDTEIRNIVAEHVAREEREKRAIPLGEAEKLAIQELAESARAAAQAQPSYPSVLDPTLAKAPAIGAGIGLGGGAMILAAAAAVFLFWHTTR